MSCDGWIAGYRCRARVSFHAREKQVGGPDIITPIHEGHEGIVERKYSDEHILYVRWQELDRSLPVWPDQMHLLERI